MPPEAVQLAAICYEGLERDTRVPVIPPLIEVYHHLNYHTSGKHRTGRQSKSGGIGKETEGRQRK